MPHPDNRKDVDRLKNLLTGAWKRVLKKVPDEQVYAFGLYTNECGQFMFPFLLGEKGLKQVAQRYIKDGTYSADTAAEELRWSTADSHYNDLLSMAVDEFDSRPDINDLSDTAAAKETQFRLTAGCTALQELDKEGLFGTGADRERVTLYLEGGDVNRAWLLKWAKKLNPKSVYDRYAAIDAPQDTVGTFTEFGTKKVYETNQYSQTADRKRIAAVTSYQLVVFDTGKQLKQRFARALPDRDDCVSLGGVAMSGDGSLIAVIPFGTDGFFGEVVFIVTGEKGENVAIGRLEWRPSAVAVSPGGKWIAVTDQAGALNVFDPSGELITRKKGHSYWPRGIALSPDGKRLATGDTKSVVLWNTSDWSQLWKVKQPIDSLDFDPTGRTIVGCCGYESRDRAPKGALLINAKTGKITREVTVPGYRIKIARFSPDGRQFACAMRQVRDEYSGTNLSALVDVKSGKVLQKLKADFEQVRDFAFLPHRNEIAVAVFGHTRRPLVLWKVETGA